jgi:hypothetical protein
MFQIAADNQMMTGRDKTAKKTWDGLARATRQVVRLGVGCGDVLARVMFWRM